MLHAGKYLRLRDCWGATMRPIATCAEHSAVPRDGRAASLLAELRSAGAAPSCQCRRAPAGARAIARRVDAIDVAPTRAG